MEKSMTANGQMVQTGDNRKVMNKMARNGKRSHVTIWLEIFRNIRSQWEEAEHGVFRRSAG